MYIFNVNLIGFPIRVQFTCAEPAKLADFSKTSPVHLRLFYKRQSVLGMCSAGCAVPGEQCRVRSAGCTVPVCSAGCAVRSAGCTVAMAGITS